MPAVLSKSRYLSGLQCPRLLWTHYNAKHRLPAPDAATQWIFDQGHEVGRLAQQLAPGGVEVPFGRMPTTVSATRKLLTLRRPIYEASFLADGVYCRVDILRPSGDRAWDLLEVKSSTSVKEVNLHDVALQRHALLAAGIELDRLFVVVLDREYVRRGPVDLAGLFVVEDVTQRVERLSGSVEPELRRMGSIIAGADPQTPIGRQCDHPYECALKPYCWAFLPEDSIATLYRAGQKRFEWLASGWTRAVEVPDSELSDPQRVQNRALREGRAHVDRAAVRSWLDTLEHPLLLLDFEAFATAVPLHDGTRPYQHVPFQVSVHGIDASGSEPRHLEHLATTADDPRPGVVEFLLALPDHGSVVVFNQTYERRILEQLAEDFPPAAAGLLSLRDRLVDLHEPFRRFDVYHPLQHGSASLKAVLPALTGRGYEDEQIRDGNAAFREYVRVMYGEVDAHERDRVLAALRSYCAKDTWAMVEILRWLEAAVAR